MNFGIPWLKGRDYSPRQARSREMIFLPRVCAVTDRLYVARYIRFGHGAYRFDRALVVRAEDISAMTTPPPLAVDAEDLISAGERCCYCRARGIVHCGVCKHWVCRGRTKHGWWHREEYFYCRKSCDNEGFLEHEPFDATFYAARAMPEPATRADKVPARNNGQVPKEVEL